MRSVLCCPAESWWHEKCGVLPTRRLVATMLKPRKYPIFRIPPDTSFPPHFSTGYLDTNFFF